MPPPPVAGVQPGAVSGVVPEVDFHPAGSAALAEAGAALAGAVPPEDGRTLNMASGKTGMWAYRSP